MEYDNTDFNMNSFDIVYSQAAISTSGRNKIVKEIKRILKPGGYFSVGELVNLFQPPPRFVNDVWERGGIKPLGFDEIENFYRERNFNIVSIKNLSGQLPDFYKLSLRLLHEKSGDETVSFNEILKRIKHEANVYLKHGGSKYMGFVSLIVRKKIEKR